MVFRLLRMIRCRWSVVFLLFLLKVISGQLNCMSDGYQRVEGSESFNSFGLLLGQGNGLKMGRFTSGMSGFDDRVF